MFKFKKSVSTEVVCNQCQKSVPVHQFNLVYKVCGFCCAELLG